VKKIGIIWWEHMEGMSGIGNEGEKRWNKSVFGSHLRSLRRGRGVRSKTAGEDVLALTTGSESRRLSPFPRLSVTAS